MVLCTAEFAVCYMLLDYNYPSGFIRIKSIMRSTVQKHTVVIGSVEKPLHSHLILYEKATDPNIQR